MNGIFFKSFGGVEGVVAGSQHIFVSETPNGMEKILHDCGNDMGEAETEETTVLPYCAQNIDGVILSHGHFDHMGDTFKLVLNRYNGFYYAHLATKDLVEMQLDYQAQNGYLEAKKYNDAVEGRKGDDGNFIPFKKPLFTSRHIREIMNKFQGMHYEVPFFPAQKRGIIATFYDAGHIIGSAQTLYEINNNGRTVKIVIAVDLGRNDTTVPIIKKPHTNFPDDIDYAFIEATYGGASHTSKDDSRAELEEVINKGYRENKRMLIGAFSIMRTHWILNDFYWIYKRGKLPADLKIYLDSPGAVKVDEIIMNHPECYDSTAVRDFRNRNDCPFHFPNLEIVRTSGYSKKLDSIKGPYIMISASGMWTMGRIVRHLKSHISDENADLVITGFQKPGCIGWQLEQKQDVVSIEGEDFKRNANVIRMHSYGSHADGRQCVEHVAKNIKPRKGVFIVHGEKAQSEWMERELRKALPGLMVETVKKEKEYSL